MDESRFGLLAKIGNSRIGGIGTLIGTLGLAKYAIDNHGWTEWSQYAELFQSSTLAHVSSVDCALLSLIVWEPMLEDMRRRGMYTDGSGIEKIRLAAFCSVPLIGPALYLATRPKLLPVEE